MGSTTQTPHVSPRRTARWSPTPITLPISEPRPALTTPRSSLHSAKHYAASSHRLIHYPAEEASSDRTANLLPPARWVPSHRPATENSQPKSTTSIPYFPKNAPSRGDTCADKAITNETATLTASPILAQGDPEKIQPEGEIGKTKPPKPRSPHLLPYP